MIKPGETAESSPQAGARPGRRPTPHYRRMQVLLTLLLVTVVFGGLEWVVRIRESRKFGPGSLRSIALRDRFTAWRNNPAYGRVDRQINAQGFRRQGNVSLEKPPNTIRIFLTGGSVAYGWSTQWPEVETRFDRLYNDQTISYYLEQRLNQAFPSRHWEVINAAVVGYQLNLELAQTESRLLRYRPDCIVYLDGHNDLLSLLRQTSPNYDPYASTPTASEFELLANPGSFRSLLFFATVWMRENSALFRKMVERQTEGEQERVPPPAEPGAPQIVDKIRPFDLNPAERERFATARSQLVFYPRLARQIHRVLDVDGVKAIFLLQPELFLTHKPPAQAERRLLDYQRHGSSLLLYAFQELYPEIGARMAEAAQQDGFVFENLVPVFDRTAAQTFTDDCHLTPEGNQVIAGRVLQLVGRLFMDKTGRISD